MAMNPLPSPRGTKAQQTRRRILSAASDELAEREGELEIASVAQRADVSAGLIYRYFSSRVDLIAAVVDDFYDQYDQWVMDINPRPGASWIQREEARTERSISFLRKHKLASVILLNRQKEPQIAAVESRRLQAHLQLAIDNVRLAQSKAEIPTDIDPEIACPMIMGGIRELLSQMLAHAEQPAFQQPRLMTQMTAFIARAMSLPFDDTANS